MGYIKVAHRKILEQLDSNNEFPTGWDKFVEKQSKFHNLLIKTNKKCYCTNCKNTFKTNKKVGEKIKCPNCKNKYLIKRSNLKYFEFKDYLSILDKVNNEFVIRFFELKTIVDANHNTQSSLVEFGREIIQKGWNYVFINERVSKCQCHISICHGQYLNPKAWRPYNRRYSLIDYSIVFPNNLKRLLKDTDFKYSCIWDLAKHCEYIDLSRILDNNDKCTLDKIEMLIKMKLYNLAQNPYKFNNVGNFQMIFGVPKDFYPFMKRFNITYTQLKLLRLLREKNINKIRYLERYVGYSGDTDNLEEIAGYININHFITYAKMHRGAIDRYLYKDYLKFAKNLGIDLKDKKYLFPENLQEEHDKYEKQYNVAKKETVNKNIENRAKLLEKNIFNDNKFIIFPAKNYEQLLDESKQQKNCVRTYAEDYARGRCDIYFMRKVEKRNKSLVTVEVKRNTVVQSRIKCNKNPSKEETLFLKKWENKILGKVA